MKNILFHNYLSRLAGAFNGINTSIKQIIEKDTYFTAEKCDRTWTPMIANSSNR